MRIFEDVVLKMLPIVPQSISNCVRPGTIIEDSSTDPDNRPSVVVGCPSQGDPWSGSLCQTFRLEDGPKGPVKVHDVLTFKTTKTEEIRVLALPASTIVALEAHRAKQDGFRRQFGSDYRADLDLIFANPDERHSDPTRYRRPSPPFSAG